MSDNKVDNKLDFRNVKHSQFGGSQIERAEYSELRFSKNWSCNKNFRVKLIFMVRRLTKPPYCDIIPLKE